MSISRALLLFTGILLALYACAGYKPKPAQSAKGKQCTAWGLELKTRTAHLTEETYHLMDDKAKELWSKIVDLCMSISI